MYLEIRAALRPAEMTISGQGGRNFSLLVSEIDSKELPNKKLGNFDDSVELWGAPNAG